MFVPGSRLICKLLDHLAAGFVAANPFRFAPQSAEEELSLDALLDFLSSLPSVDYTLRPSYDRHSLNWLLEILESKNLHGRLRKTLVRKPSGEAAGWYIYYVNPGGISEVLQIGANSDSVKLVTQHMAYCAWKHGAFALTGRIDPRFMDELSEQNFLFHRGNRPWMLIHSKDPGILASFHRGRAFVTRMEGEWWVGSRRQEISSAGTP